MKAPARLLLPVALAAAVAAWGQSGEASLSMGASIFTDKNLGQLGVGGAAETLRLGNGLRVTVRLSLNPGTLLGHEVGYGYDRSHLISGLQGKTGMPVHQGFYNLLIHALPKGSMVRPFVCGGVGFSSFFPPGTSASYGNGITKFGYIYGAGVKVKTGIKYGIRLDVRDYVTAKPFDLPGVSGRLHNVEVSAGFAVFF